MPHGSVFFRSRNCDIHAVSIDRGRPSRDALQRDVRTFSGKLGPGDSSAILSSNGPGSGPSAARDSTVGDGANAGLDPTACRDPIADHGPSGGHDDPSGDRDRGGRGLPLFR
jgi:hypothetical protein